MCVTFMNVVREYICTIQRGKKLNTHIGEIV